MTTIRISGVKGYVSNGTAYYYLRATGERILDPATKNPIDPRTQLEVFVDRVGEIPMVGTMGTASEAEIALALGKLVRVEQDILRTAAIASSASQRLRWEL